MKYYYCHFNGPFRFHCPLLNTQFARGIQATFDYGLKSVNGLNPDTKEIRKRSRSTKRGDWHRDCFQFLKADSLLANVDHTLRFLQVMSGAGCWERLLFAEILSKSCVQTLAVHWVFKTGPRPGCLSRPAEFLCGTWIALASKCLGVAL